MNPPTVGLINRADAVINRDQRGVFVQLRFRLLIERGARGLIRRLQRGGHDGVERRALIEHGIDAAVGQHRVQERAGLVVIPAPWRAPRRIAPDGGSPATFSIPRCAA